MTDSSKIVFRCRSGDKLTVDRKSILYRIGCRRERPGASRRTGMTGQPTTNVDDRTQASPLRPCRLRSLAALRMTTLLGP